MKRKGKNKTDEKYLKTLGRRIRSLIRKKGYASPYDFWVEKGEDLFSRPSLHYILNGQADAKITTLKAIADGLGVSVREFLEFDQPRPSIDSE